MKSRRRWSKSNPWKPGYRHLALHIELSGGTGRLQSRGNGRPSNPLQSRGGIFRPYRRHRHRPRGRRSRRGHFGKHFTLDRGMNGPDHRASLSPAELKAMILGVRRLEKAIGDGDKRPRPSEAPVAAVARRSLFAKTDISRNDSFSIAMLSLSGRPAASLRTASTT